MELHKNTFKMELNHIHTRRGFNRIRIQAHSAYAVASLTASTCKRGNVQIAALSWATASLKKRKQGADLGTSEHWP